MVYLPLRRYVVYLFTNIIKVSTWKIPDKYIMHFMKYGLNSNQYLPLPTVRYCMQCIEIWDSGQWQFLDGQTIFVRMIRLFTIQVIMFSRQLLVCWTKVLYACSKSKIPKMNTLNSDLIKNILGPLQYFSNIIFFFIYSEDMIFCIHVVIPQQI